MSLLRRVANARLLRIVSVAIVAVACPPGSDPGPSCTVTNVAVQPTSATLNVGETATLTATVSSSNCVAQPGVTWSGGTAAVGVAGNGNQATVTAVSPTTSPVSVTATAQSMSSSSQITVLALPAIALSATSRSYTAVQGGANPASQTVTITNSGGGTLSGLGTGTITYGAGATGWLQAPGLSGTTANPSATLTLQPVTGSLVPGTYTATVPVTASGASNSPQNITVTFTVTAPPPMIALNPTSRSFTATQGAANPASQTVAVTNSGGGTLSGLSIGTVTYGAGASGWLQTPTLSGTTAPATVTLQPLTGSLTPGTYSATVPVLSSVATNSPQNITVNFTVNAVAANPCAFASATPIAVGQTINGTLSTTTSCLLTSGHYADNYVLNLSSTTGVRIDLMASHDTYLFLLDFTTGAVIEEDDDDGAGLNSQITRSLAPGQYILQATTFSTGVTGAYSIGVAQVVGGAPASVVVTAGNAQKVAPNTAVPIPPSVTVLDAVGVGVPNIAVTFATLSGVGSITGASATTNAQGIATVGSWTLAAGPNVMSATAAGVTAPAVVSATGVTSSAGYNVDLRFITMPTLPQFQAFASAVTRWQTIITNDLADINNVVLGPNACANNSPAISENMDDLVIQVSLTAIDGPGGVLGSAGPCFIRTAGALPLLGAMQFDIADLATLESNGSLNSVILHEMGHIIGIGTLWTHPTFNLLANPSLPSSPGVDTRFTGVNGIAGFDAIGGTTYTGGGKVPVENTQGGQGTRDAHWRESVLVNELMTGFLNAGSNPLSMLTVRSLQDMGYQVNTAAADPFFLTLTLVDEGAQPPRIRLLDDVRVGPIYHMDERGRITDRQGRPIPGQANPQKPRR